MDAATIGATDLAEAEFRAAGIRIVNERHLRKVLTEYESYFNNHRPHRTLKQASPLRALPDPVDADTKVIRHDRLGGLIHEYAQVA